MSEIKDGGPAFPLPLSSVEPHGSMTSAAYGLAGCSGMSLRDWFAGKAMQAIISVQTGEKFEPQPIVVDSYKMADAMIRERDRNP